MFCEKCGKEIKDGDKFCPYCGAENEINKEEPSHDIPSSSKSSSQLSTSGSEA